MNKPQRLGLWCGAVLLLVAAVESPSILTAWGFHSAGKMAEQRTAGQQLYIAIQSAALDHQQMMSTRQPGAEESVSWPADCGAQSQTAYLDQLVQNGYIKADEMKRICKTLGDFAIGNVSDKDDGPTILLISRNAAEAILPKKDTVNGPYFVVHKGGDSQSRSHSGPADITGVPPRDPPFLAP